LERLETEQLDGRAARWRWMAEHARLGLMTPESTSVALQLTAQAFARPRRVRISLQGQPLAVITIRAERSRYEIGPLDIQRGVSVLELESLDAADSPPHDPRRLSIALFGAQITQTKTKPHMPQITF
jgi:hypothetical protein